MIIPQKIHHAVSKKSVRIKTYSVELIFEFIKNNPEAKHYVDGENKCKLRRAKVFYEKGLSCIENGCKLTGSFFALEQWPAGDFHFDLFSVDETGEEVLMTIDHIFPKSKGGKDHISNYQPMCKVHNELKSDNG